MQVAKREEAYSQQSLAGIVNNLIGTMYARERNIILSRDQDKWTS